MGELRSISGRVRLMGHHIEKRSVTALEQFWTTLFRIRTDVAVITTNYDILAERGLRSAPRPRIPVRASTMAAVSRPWRVVPWTQDAVTPLERYHY